MLTFPHIFESARVATPQSGNARDSHNATFKASDATVAPSDAAFKPSSATLVSHEPSRVSPTDRSANTLFVRTTSRRVSAKFICTMLCAVAAIVSGCAATQKPRARAFPWASANTVRPLAPARASSDVSNDDLFADLGLDVPAPPSVVGAAPSGPPRPRVAVVPSSGGNSSRVPEAPMIAPQLSPEQTAQAQQQAAASVSVAEKNLAGSQGRSLNAMQSDLASKVRSFLAEAREAAQVGDWTRASSAAKKAEVLSQELASSL
jgi:hypothetical protein